MMASEADVVSISKNVLGKLGLVLAALGAAQVVLGWGDISIAAQTGTDALTLLLGGAGLNYVGSD